MLPEEVADGEAGQRGADAGHDDGQNVAERRDAADKSSQDAGGFHN